MKSVGFKSSVLSGMALAMTVISACKGGGGGSGGADVEVYVDLGVFSDPGYTDPGYTDPGYTDPGSSGSSGCDASGCNSLSGRTRDVDLQRANYEQQALNARAQVVADKFQMNFDSAIQLTQLSDKIQVMKKQGQMTTADRDALTQSAFGIAGVTPDEVNNALSQSIAGDDRATDELLDKAATNLGMPSGAALRDQLLPAMGVKTN